MERNEIIKALECCLVESNCTDCPLRSQYEIDCLKYAGVKALSLIKELTNEVEKLDASCTELAQACKTWQQRMKIECNYTKYDTVRKMQERLDKHFCHDPAFLGVEQRLIMDVIDQIAEEMIGGGNADKED